MGKFKHFLGIDVSKEYFDAVIILNSDRNTKQHARFENSSDGLHELHSWLKDYGTAESDTLVCLEHTGLYGKIIIRQLMLFGYSVWVEMSLKIIRSIGVQRGKNDKIDAERIAYYAMKNADEARVYTAPRKSVEHIRLLLSWRDKLVETRAAVKKSIRELDGFDKELSELSAQSMTHTLAGLETDLANIEKQLDSVVRHDENLNRIFKLATSVPSIGKITALYLICFTNEFTMYSTPRQLACYCGVVPFEHTSGKSVRSKPKVHHMANKKMKKQLHLCAMSAVAYDPEMKQYYTRKVEEGKSKMLVINNVRNKLIHRVCACIRENRMFEKRMTA